jgi:hypothetical protein
MPNTYKLINSTTVGAGGAASISFTSIPQTYTDLVLKFSARNSSTATNIFVTINGATAYASNRLYAGGSSVASDTYTGFYITPNDFTANIFGSSEAYFTNYTNALGKSFAILSLGENNSSQAYMVVGAGTDPTTSAITSVGIVPESSNTFRQYTTAYLYGIKNS